MFVISSHNAGATCQLIRGDVFCQHDVLQTTGDASQLFGTLAVMVWFWNAVTVYFMRHKTPIFIVKVTVLDAFLKAQP